MGNMGELSVLLIGVVDALFAFFVVAPIMLNTASLFGVQKRFAQAMVEEGVIDADTVKLLHPKKHRCPVLGPCPKYAVGVPDRPMPPMRQRRPFQSRAYRASRAHPFVRRG